jgi:2',3'-cyclic-nucleotide 2'-phosphodiesterase/3'-nucleotidase
MRANRILVSVAVLVLALGCGADPGGGGDAGWDAGGPADAGPRIPAGATAVLALLETTDLHQNIRSYDYFKLAEDRTVGLERTATLIKQARAQFPNTLLIDNGDTIQGTVLGDYQAVVSQVPCSQQLGIYKVMDALRYDVGGVGNHEFNFGLSYLNQVTGSQFVVDGLTGPSVTTRCAGPRFPLVLSNVVSTKSSQPLFPPYVILERTLAAKDAAGGDLTARVKVGVLAFTPPYVLVWDKGHLDGKVTTTGIRETATRYVAELRSQGVDLIVAISHGGLDNAAYDPGMENGSYYLAQVEGLDALLLGHSHQPFPTTGAPAAQFKLPSVSNDAGTVFGVPTVMANFWGKHLGVIELSLTHDGVKWSVDRSKTVAQTRPALQADGGYVAVDPTIAPLVEYEHQATITYVKTPLGSSDFALNSYFADVGDISALQVVNQAQTAYVKSWVANSGRADLTSLPVLSVTAPFKSGFGGGTDYTDVASGPVAINNAADLYLFANTVHAVKVTGAIIKDWLEKAASRFNRIDPALTTPQQLISTFPGYNFDVFTDPDLSYEIDVTQPAATASVPGNRIKNLKYRGAAIDPAASFIVATNNYRASGGGGFPGLDGTRTVLAAPDTNRDALIAFIRSSGALSRAANGSARSWSFTKVTTAGPVVFSSALGKLSLATAAGLTNVSGGTVDDGTSKGLGVYTLDLSR